MGAGRWADGRTALSPRQTFYEGRTDEQASRRGGGGRMDERRAPVRVHRVQARTNKDEHSDELRP